MAGVYMECGHWNRSIWLKLNDMRKKGIACDVELVADGSETRYPAHLCILAAGSPHLKAQLQGVADINRSTQIRMSGYSAPVLESVLEFMYTGSLAIQHMPISEVEKAAKTLQMRDLAMLCNKVMESQQAVPQHYKHFIMLENSLWNKTIWHNLNVLRAQKQFCNLTLQIDSTNSFDTHACLLMAASSFFRKNLPVAKIEEGVSIYLDLSSLAVSSTGVQRVLDYIYLGSFSCVSQNLQAIMDCASALKLEELIRLLQGIQNKHQIPKVLGQDDTHDYDDGAPDAPQDTTQSGVVHKQPGTERQALPLNQSSDTADELQHITEVDSKELQALLKDGSLKVLQSDGQAVSVVVDTSAQVAQADSVDTSARVVDGNSAVELAYLADELNSQVNGQQAVVITEQDDRGNVISELQQPMNDAELTAFFKSKRREKKTEQRKEKLYDEIPMDHNLEFSRAEDGSFVCPHCGKHFRKKFEARVHSVKHTGHRPYVCRQCGMAFKFKTNVMAHLKVHTGQKPHRCKTCGKLFRRLWDMQLHERTHTKEKPYQCLHCPKTFAQSANRYTHMRHVHGGFKRTNLRGDFQCLQCGKHFMTAKSLTNHENSHTGEHNTVYCDTCGQSFISIYSLRRHIKRGACQKNMGTKQYNELKVVEGIQECSHCSQQFDDFEALRNHLLASGCMDQMENPPHFFRIDHNFVCFQCSTSFKNFRLFREHDESKDCEKILSNDLAPAGDDAPQMVEGSLFHKEGSRFICISCGASFVNVNCLKRHKKRGACAKNVLSQSLLRTLHGEDLVCCDRCGESFAEAAFVTKHKLSGQCRQSKTEVLVRCSLCDQSFISEQALNRHKQQAHSTAPKIKEEFVHVEKATISTNKLFACQECGSSFSTAASVRRHKIRGACDKILGIKPRGSGEKIMKVQCDGCEKRFSSRDSLQKHIKRGVCAGVREQKLMDVQSKQYSCLVCNSLWDSYTDLREHVTECAQTPDGIVHFKAAVFSWQNAPIVKLERGQETDGEDQLKTIQEASMREDIEIIQKEFCKEVSDTDGVNLKCDVCQKKFETIEDFDPHWVEEHSIKCPIDAASKGLSGCYICPFCTFISRRYDNHREHVYGCSNFPDGEDPEMYLYRKIQNGDENSGKKSTDEPNSAEPSSTTDQTVMRSEVIKGKAQSDNGPKQKKTKVTVSCSICDAQFSTMGELNNHTKTQHGLHGKSAHGLLPLVCNICNKIFETQKGLDGHQEKFPEGSCKMSKDKARVTVMLSCKRCDAKFSSVSQLRQHYVRDHNFVIFESSD